MKATCKAWRTMLLNVGATCTTSRDNIWSSKCWRAMLAEKMARFVTAFIKLLSFLNNTPIRKLSIDFENAPET